VVGTQNIIVKEYTIIFSCVVCMLEEKNKIKIILQAKRGTDV
jgi:hypothetical protein